jgi:hypothetical protein
MGDYFIEAVEKMIRKVVRSTLKKWKLLRGG